MAKRIGVNLRMMAMAAALAMLSAGAAHAYAVICVHGKYEVDSRSDDQLKMAFGSSYCLIRRFNYRSDAEDWAKKNNMKPGTKCSC